MKAKKATALVCVIALIGAMGITTVFAANKGIKANFDSAQSQAYQKQGPRAELTEEQRTQMQQKRAEMENKLQEQKSKWDALTQEQKAEIYALDEDAANTKIKMIDKYVEYGLIDNDDASKMKEGIADRLEQNKEGGRPPMLFGNEKCMRGERKGGPRGMRDFPSTQTPSAENKTE